ncbi:MAG: hypothetical protein QOI24_1118 [Acidobacteriota bacterium]|jgi:hypothetical protein|nr:hypothetical protein [Acidobacteriota bacterium]
MTPVILSVAKDPGGRGTPPPFSRTARPDPSLTLGMTELA